MCSYSMTECVVCLGECTDVFRSPKCTCVYYIHEYCHRRTCALVNIGCVYCRWAIRPLDNGFDDHDLDYIISFDDQYFIWAAQIVGILLLWSMVLSGTVVCYLFICEYPLLFHHT